MCTQDTPSTDKKKVFLAWIAGTNEYSDEGKLGIY